MSITSRLGIGLAVVCFAAMMPSSATAQAYGRVGYGSSYGYGYGNPYGGSSFGYSPSYGYGMGSGYAAVPRFYNPPLTYNNLNGVAGMIGQTVNRRSYYYGSGVRRRR